MVIIRNPNQFGPPLGEQKKKLEQQQSPPPVIQPTPSTPTTTPPPVPTVYVDNKTGKQSGVTLPDGRTFLGVNQQDINKIVNADQQQQQLPQGAVLQSEAAQQQAQAQQGLPQGVDTSVPQQAQQNIQTQQKTEGPTYRPIDRQSVLVNQIYSRIKKGTATPEEIASLQLTPLDIQNIQQGEVNTSDLAIAVEGIPLLGKLHVRTQGVRFGLSDFTGTQPNQKIQDLLDTIDKNSADITGLQSGMATNPYLAGQYQAEIENKKNEILKLESRIKLLSYISPEVQKDPDTARAITTKIANAKRLHPELNWYS